MAIALWADPGAMVSSVLFPGRASRPCRIPAIQRQLRAPRTECMRQILYNMHFRSQTSPVVDHSDVVRTTGSATGCVVSTMIRPSGVQADIKPSDGDLAFFESELRVTGPDGFRE